METAILKTVVIEDGAIDKIVNGRSGMIEELMVELGSSNMAAINNQSPKKPYVVKVSKDPIKYGWINKSGIEELDEYDAACVAKIAKKL